MNPARGDFVEGDHVQLRGPKSTLHTITLETGGQFHTHKGVIAHDDLIGSPEGSVVTSDAGVAYLALRPLLGDFVLSMARGAAIIYPKDAAHIVAIADVAPGHTVMEAGVGSGSLTLSLLRAVGRAVSSFPLSGGRSSLKSPQPMWPPSWGNLPLSGSASLVIFSSGLSNGKRQALIEWCSTCWHRGNVSTRCLTH